VSKWREQFDASAAQGMPAHITVLYPFLTQDRLTEEVLAQLAEMCAQSPVLDVQFQRAARFPGVIYLDPEPADGLRQLTLAIAAGWPEASPYGGVFDEVIPHLTVAYGSDARVLDDIESDVLRGLPLSTRLVDACVYRFDGDHWRLRARMPFQGSS